MKKNIYIGLVLVLAFIIIVYVTKKTIYTIPCILTLYFLVGLKSKSIKQTLTIITPIIIVWISHFFGKDNLYSVAIFYIVFIPSVSFLGFYLRNKNLIIKLFVIISFIPIGFYLFPNWFELYHNYGARVNKKSPKIEFYSENGSLVRLDTVKNKVIVLDFWSTTCGICIKEFPDVENVDKMFKDNKSVNIYTVNIPYKKDTINQAKALLNKRGVKIKSLFAKNSDVSDTLGFNRYPRLVIIKDGRIRYNGRVIVEKDIIFYRLEDEINRLLQKE